ncbi:hypothetical protein ACFFKU_07570 [Kineococcus gynurae]|uniref:DUF4190 domain-containing protein n=1 Tax=Kineococcus gynurae TaxID=452979 RepID=A0ABV5LWT6_9ACTN
MSEQPPPRDEGRDGTGSDGTGSDGTGSDGTRRLPTGAGDPWSSPGGTSGASQKPTRAFDPRPGAPTESFAARPDAGDPYRSEPSGAGAPVPTGTGWAADPWSAGSTGAPASAPRPAPDGGAARDGWPAQYGQAGPYGQSAPYGSAGQHGHPGQHGDPGQYGWSPGAQPPLPPVAGLAQGVLWTGVGSLALWLLSAGLLSWIPAIVALVLAPGARRAVRATPGGRGQGHVTGGVVCAWVALGLSLLTVAIVAVLAVSWIGVLGASTWSDPGAPWENV